MAVSERPHAADAKKEPVVIKKYANRRLYNTDTSTYVTLDDLAQMVRAERDFIVYDAKTGEDLTHSVLTQIIVEQEGRGTSMLPVPFLRQLIRFYGDSMSAFVPSYLQLSMESLARDQERLRNQFAHLFSGKGFPQIPFGTAAFEAMQQQTRQNMAMFERALSMFSPFHGTHVGGAGGNANANPGAAGSGSHTAAAPASQGGSVRKTGEAPQPPARAGSPNELAELRTQLEAMQAKIEKIAGGKS